MKETKKNFVINVFICKNVGKKEVNVKNVKL